MEAIERYEHKVPDYLLGLPLFMLPKDDNFWVKPFHQSPKPAGDYCVHFEAFPATDVVEDIMTWSVYLTDPKYLVRYNT